MDNIKKYEGIFWTTKNDLYLKNKGFEKRSGYSHKSEDNYLGVKLTNMKDYKEININPAIACGVINYYEQSGSFRFSSRVTYYDSWYDPSYYINRLEQISVKLGLEVGKTVNIIDEKVDAMILDVKPLVFYKNGSSFIYKEKIDTLLTLAYKISPDGSDPRWYQAIELDVIKTKTDMSIVEGEVEDNFIDYIDNKELKFTSSKFRNNGKECFNCRLLIDLKDIARLADITKRLNIVKKRLSERNITLEVSSIDMLSVSFICKQN